jgi:REP element-mobilizing transposase RayT
MQPGLTPEERDLVFGIIRRWDGERLELRAVVVMDDHVHVVVVPHPGQILGRILHSWKSFSANRLQRTTGRTGRVWQADSYDRIVRDDRELTQTIQYIRHNPVRRWPGCTGYPWLWIADTKCQSGE